MSEQAITTAPVSGPDAHTEDRLIAFASRDRDQALAKYPELQRAFEIEDASRRFARRYVSDPEFQGRFQQMTDRYIREKLLAQTPREALVQRERDLQLQQEQELSR